MTSGSPDLTINALSELSGVALRTIRYYVQNGILSPPVGEKRAARYSTGHLDQLSRIKGLQAEGHSLDLIRRLLHESGEPVGQEKTDISVWTRIQLAPGLEVHIDASQAELSTSQLRRLAQDFRNSLRNLKRD